jgi:alpha-1,3/alpha-1,6-mannosyltransferase
MTSDNAYHDSCLLKHHQDPPIEELPYKKYNIQEKSTMANRSNIIIIHPDLGIGGAERLIIDVALALQNRGHQVTIYTSHRDKAHCFEEARDGTLDVRVRGNTVLPALLFGRFHLLMAALRQVHLTMSVFAEMGRTGKKRKQQQEGEYQNDVFIVDQLSACVPILKTLGERYARAGGQQRILFYCHFPDQLLARRNEGNLALRLLKEAYRYPLDWFEGWAMSASDRVVANSSFTRGVVRRVFGEGRLGDVKVVYPCVDTKEAVPEDKKKGKNKTEVVEGGLWDGKKILLSINRFERKKGIDLAVRAYNGLSEEARRGTRLVIAGKSLASVCVYGIYIYIYTDMRRWLRQPCPRKRPIS